MGAQWYYDNMRWGHNDIMIIWDGGTMIFSVVTLMVLGSNVLTNVL